MRLRYPANISNRARAWAGFLLGLAIMLMVVQVFQVNRFDFDNMRTGTAALLHGVNPWATGSRIPHFYNPPFAVLFLWPLLFTTPKAMLVVGGALLFAVLFYLRAWPAFAWFLTNTFLWMVAAGGVDMYLMGAGLLLLFFSDRALSHKPADLGGRGLQTLLRVLAYGFLMVKPQGGLLITAFYIVKRRDWAGLLASLVVYGLAFAPLYPNWIAVLRADPPLAQTEASHSLMTQFGPWAALALAGVVLLSRRWAYWQIGGALAGILMPYGMPGIPILLTLTAVQKLAAIPAVLAYSAGLAYLTWRSAWSPLLGVYHLGMLGLALVLACLLPAPEPAESDRIGLSAGLPSRWRSVLNHPG